MSTAARRILTLAVALCAVLAMAAAMFLAPRFFTGAPEAFYTPASTKPAAAAQPALSRLDADAPVPETGILTAQLDAILADRDDGAKFTAQVVDVATGKVLYDRHAETPGTPASSLKVATAVAALDTLGGDAQLPTTVLLDGDVLVLRGGGDVLLGSGESDDSHPRGYAGLGTLAQLAAKQLEQRGIDSVKLWLDDSLFADAHHTSAWDQSLYTSNNIADIYPLAHYGGRAGASLSSAYQADAANEARKSFAAALSKYVAVETGGRGTYSGGEQIAQVRSAPLREQLRHMLLVSDNYMAETMGRLVALKLGMDPSQGPQAVAKVAEKFDAKGLELEDTSGLAAKDRISPAALTALLRGAADSPKAELRELAYSLPVAGYTGTLMTRLGQDATAGLVRAKTGSLAGVATLTGLTVTADGRQLAFSIFVNQPGGPVAPHKPVIDQAAAAIHGCGCN